MTVGSRYTDFYVALRKQYVSAFGVVGHSRSGNALPKMNAFTVISYGAVWAKAVREYCAKARVGAILISDVFDLTSKSRFEEAKRGAKNPAALLDEALAARPVGTPSATPTELVNPPRRSASGLLYGLVTLGTNGAIIGTADEQARTIRVMRAYDAMIEAVGPLASPFRGNRECTLNEVEALFNASYQLASEIQTIDMRIPESEYFVALKDGAKEGLKNVRDAGYAIVEGAADAAGRVAAVAGTAAGKAVGAAVGGFFDEAGLIAWTVVGFAAFLVVKGVV